MPPLCNRLTVSLGSGTFLRLPIALFNYEKKNLKKTFFLIAAMYQFMTFQDWNCNIQIVHLWTACAFWNCFCGFPSKEAKEKIIAFK
jgi:hypothetical protein